MLAVFAQQDITSTMLIHAQLAQHPASRASAIKFAQLVPLATLLQLDTPKANVSHALLLAAHATALRHTALLVFQATANRDGNVKATRM